MAHFARVADGIVQEVIVVADSDCAGGSFPESETVGQSFIASVGLQGEWLQTSYNSNFRGMYAGLGTPYDPTVDEFVSSVVQP